MVMWALLLFSALPAWQSLGEGLEYAAVPLPDPAPVAKPILHAVRIDPAKAPIRLLTVTKEKGENRTAGQWCKEFNARVAINAGMFAVDHKTHVGKLVDKNHVNSGSWNSYQSVLLFSPKTKSIPGALIVDRDDPKLAEKLAQYDGVAQNLRLIRNPRINVWKKTSRRWSEAFIAMDARGRILFLFTRAPYTMAHLNEMVLSLPLEIVAAQHVEGGPEASLSIRTKDLNLDLSGSYETGFFWTDENDRQWVLPSVLVVN